MNSLQHILPEQDPDLALARQIGDFLEGRINPPVHNPTFRLLAGFRQASEQGAQVLHMNKETIWQNIERSIQQQSSALPGKPQIQGKPTPLKIWQAAAAFAAAAALLLWAFLPQNPQKEQFTALENNAVFELTDGSRIQLRKNASIQIEYRDRRVSVALKGDGKFEVAKNPGRVFEVVGETGRVEVTGTVFYVKQLPGVQQVYLETGSVKVINEQGQVALSPGEQAEIPQKSPPRIQKSTLDAVSAWTRNELVFDSRPLQEIIQELELHFSVTIEIPDHLKNESITGSMVLEGDEQVFNDLARVMGGKFVREGNHRRFVAD